MSPADVLGEGEAAREFNLASAEDVILNKLEWYEMGGRDRRRRAPRAGVRRGGMMTGSHRVDTGSYGT